MQIIGLAVPLPPSLCLHCIVIIFISLFLLTDILSSLSEEEEDEEDIILDLDGMTPTPKRLKCVRD